MGLLNLFRRKKTFAVPPNVNSNINVESIYSQQTRAFRLFGSFQFIDFYENVAPCSDAIDKLAGASTHIEIKVKDATGFVDNPQVSQILDAPNVLQTWHEIYMALATFFLITGNTYVMVTRSSVGKMLEIFILEPQHVTVETDNTFFIRKYNYNNARSFGVNSRPFGELSFVKNEIKGQLRYLTPDGTKEIYHLKNLNANGQQTREIGTSPLRSIVYELSQDQAGSIHNLSILKNGTTIGGIIQLDKDATTPDQEANLIAQVENKFQGARNAGRAVISSLIKDFKPTMQSNKDMDFQALKEQITERIYENLNIPLALVKSNSLSLANMEQAQFQFYHNAVCPLTNRIYAFLTKIFRDYFPTFESQSFAYDTFSIDALRFRRLEELQIQAALNISTDNELRNKIDLPDYDGGNEIYKPANMIPVEEVNDEPDQAPEAAPEPKPEASPAPSSTERAV